MCLPLTSILGVCCCCCCFVVVVLYIFLYSDRWIFSTDQDAQITKLDIFGSNFRKAPNLGKIRCVFVFVVLFFVLFCFVFAFFFFFYKIGYIDKKGIDKFKTSKSSRHIPVQK